MKFSTAAAAALIGAASTTIATPVSVSELAKRADAPTDLQVLQYALTLEHLEAAFYAEVLAKFSDDDFCKAGFEGWVRGRVSQIAQHEASHVKLLSAALGDAAVKPCNYAFGIKDVRSTMIFAAGLENIGVSAYSGANQFISDPLYSTVAATILSVEARHQGHIGGPILRREDWTGPYDTPLGLDQVYTLAAQLITSCPDSNAALPVRAAKPLTSGGSPLFDAAAGSFVKLDFDGDHNAAGLKAVLYNGLGAVVLDYTNGGVTLPDGVQGFSYVLLTTAADAASVTTDNTVAGPAVIQTEFSAWASNPGFQNPYGA